MLRGSSSAACALALLGGCSLILDFGGSGGEEAADGAPVIDGATAVDAAPTPDATPVADAPPTGFPRSCAAVKAADPRAASGVTTIDDDGPTGPLDPRQAYCEQTLAAGGWELLSIVPYGGVAEGGVVVPIMGEATCLDPVAACAGHLAPAQVSTQTEILIQDLSAGEHLILSGFSASATSALRYWSRELVLTTGEACTAPHVCNSSELDPALELVTSGYAMAYTPPLQQWWRQGGWWIGAGATPGSGAGNVFRTSYAAVNWLSTRATPAGTSTIRAQGTQRVFARVPVSTSDTL